MNEIFTLTLQDLETLITKGHCACHIINPNKTRIILWKSQDDPNTYYLRIGIQKFISYPLKDKNKDLYWRFNCKTEEPTINPDPNNPITKYQQRLEKEGVHSELSQKTQAINHDKSNSTVNSPEQSESTSH